MKRFDYDKVKKVAIDRPDHQQLYVLDHQHRDLVIAVLGEMGFTSDSESLSQRFDYLPWAVNVKDKIFFTVGVVAMIACPVSQGAKVLRLDQMMELIHDDADLSTF